MLKLPQHFDQNEYFIICSILFLLVVWYCLPKIVSLELSLVNGFFFIILGLLADQFLGVEYPYDFYDTLDASTLDLFDELIYLIIYPFYGYFHIYFILKFKVFKKSLEATILYIFFWAIISSGFELLSVIFNVFRYKHGWNVGYSFLTYLLVFVITQLFSRMTLNLSGDKH